MALINQETIKKVQQQVATTNTSSFSATSVTFNQSFDSNIHEEIYNQTDEYTGYKSAYDAANDTEEDQELCTNPYTEVETNPVEEIVERMKNGETVELDNDMMNKVCEHLAENFMNYLFRSVNGQASLKVKE